MRSEARTCCLEQNPGKSGESVGEGGIRSLTIRIYRKYYRKSLKDKLIPLDYFYRSNTCYFRHYSVFTLFESANFLRFTTRKSFPKNSSREEQGLAFPFFVEGCFTLQLVPTTKRSTTFTFFLLPSKISLFPRAPLPRDGVGL